MPDRNLVGTNQEPPSTTMNPPAATINIATTTTTTNSPTPATSASPNPIALTKATSIQGACDDDSSTEESTTSSQDEDDESDESDDADEDSNSEDGTFKPSAKWTSINNSPTTIPTGTPDPSIPAGIGRGRGRSRTRGGTPGSVASSAGGRPKAFSRGGKTGGGIEKGQQTLGAFLLKPSAADRAVGAGTARGSGRPKDHPLVGIERLGAITGQESLENGKGKEEEIGGRKEDQEVEEKDANVDGKEGELEQKRTHGLGIVKEIMASDGEEDGLGFVGQKGQVVEQDVTMRNKEVDKDMDTHTAQRNDEGRKLVDVDMLDAGVDEGEAV